MTGERRFDANVGGFFVSHFADHNDVRIGSEKCAHRFGKGKVDLGLDLHLPPDSRMETLKADLEQLVKESRVASYEPREAIIEFGEDPTFLGVLLEGELSVSVPAARMTPASWREATSKLSPGPSS